MVKNYKKYVRRVYKEEYERAERKRFNAKYTSDHKTSN